MVGTRGVSTTRDGQEVTLEAIDSDVRDRSSSADKYVRILTNIVASEADRTFLDIEGTVTGAPRRHRQRACSRLYELTIERDCAADSGISTSVSGNL